MSHSLCIHEEWTKKCAHIHSSWRPIESTENPKKIPPNPKESTSFLLDRIFLDNLFNVPFSARCKKSIQIFFISWYELEPCRWHIHVNVHLRLLFECYILWINHWIVFDSHDNFIVPWQLVSSSTSSDYGGISPNSIVIAHTRNICDEVNKNAHETLNFSRFNTDIEPFPLVISNFVNNFAPHTFPALHLDEWWIQCYKQI